MRCKETNITLYAAQMQNALDLAFATHFELSRITSLHKVNVSQLKEKQQHAASVCYSMICLFRLTNAVLLHKILCK